MQRKSKTTSMIALKLAQMIVLSAPLCLPTLTYAQTKPIIKIDGSSTVFPISEAIAEEFQSSQKGKVNVTVGISGTGGGLKKLCRDEIDIANASRPISEAEMKACREQGIEYFELPIAYDALTIVVNPHNTFIQQMTIAQLNAAWKPEAQNTIKSWDQVDAAYPAETLQLFGPDTDSGTFDYFTEAVNGKAKATRGDYTASSDDNALVQGIMRNKSALAYLGFAYYVENKDKLKAVAIVNPQTGKAVLPSKDTVLSGEYSPLSRPLFIYLNAKALNRPEVKSYIDFVMKKGGSLANEVGYVSLPEQAYKTNLTHLEAGKKGTVFGGVAEIGLTIDALLKRESKL